MTQKLSGVKQQNFFFSHESVDPLDISFGLNQLRRLLWSGGISDGAVCSRMTS